MNKTRFCGVETKSMFIHTRSSAPKRSAKFGWQTRTFCHKEVGKAKLEPDRLQFMEMGVMQTSTHLLSSTLAFSEHLHKHKRTHYSEQ